MLIGDSVDQALSVALKAMGDNPWDDLGPAVQALEKEGFTINNPAELQPIVNRLVSAGRLKPKVMGRSGLGWHPKAATCVLVLD